MLEVSNEVISEFLGENTLAETLMPKFTYKLFDNQTL